MGVAPANAAGGQPFTPKGVQAVFASLGERVDQLQATVNQHRSEHDALHRFVAQKDEEYK